MMKRMQKVLMLLMAAALLAGKATLAETTMDGNELLNSATKDAAWDSAITANVEDIALDFDAAYTSNALNRANQNAVSADEWGNEGGVIGVYVDNQLVTMAVRYYNSIVAVSNSEIQTWTSLEIYDFETGKSYPARLRFEKDALMFFDLDEMPEAASLYISSGIPAGVTIGAEGGLYGYGRDGQTISVMKVQAIRPADGELFGAYSGAELLPGSPIFWFTSDKERVILGLADEGQRYLDMYEYDKRLRAAAAASKADNPTSAPTSAPTDAPTSVPTSVPTAVPTSAPTSIPAGASTDAPTNVPTSVPTEVPTSVPTDVPTDTPTAVPTTQPPAASDPATQTILYAVIGILAVAVVALILTRGRKRTGDAQKSETATQVLPQKAEKAQGGDEPTQRLEIEATQPEAHVALDCVGGTLKGMSFPLTARVVIGRDPKRCAIIYPKDAKGISGVHCAAEPMPDGRILLTDLGSTYGTMVNGRKLTAGTGVCVNPGERFTLGGSENVFAVRRL